MKHLATTCGSATRMSYFKNMVSLMSTTLLMHRCKKVCDTYVCFNACQEHKETKFKNCSKPKTVINTSKYRKSNLFAQEQYNVIQTQNSRIDTSISIRGTFAMFDVLTLQGVRFKICVNFQTDRFSRH